VRLFVSADDGEEFHNSNEWRAPGVSRGKEQVPPLSPVAMPWASAILRRGEMVCVPDLDSLPAEAASDQRALRQRPVRALLYAPLLWRERLVGCVGFSTITQLRVWTEEEHTVLRMASQVVVNALQRKRGEEELRKLHSQLVDASRQAGMAEVATGVLHSVGNVLNSINVSVTLVGDRLRRSETATLARVVEMLPAEPERLAGFLTQDPRGKQVPEFLRELSRQLEQERAALCHEHGLVVRHIDHMKEVVAMQQNYARLSGMIEPIQLADSVQDALRLVGAELERHRIEVVRDFAAVPDVLADRHKVLQIVVNLLHNAKHALAGARPDRARIDLTLRHTQEDRVDLVVRDNGVGIPQENLVRIFAHGFTTKKDGHGFGLHSGANAAREMGGRLAASSDGPGQGAAFTLELPACKPVSSYE
jgi:C4-dicarboxylate-specific signal transduction histidine kinase